MMEYKGYIGRVEYDDDAGFFHGDVINIRDVITFQGKSVAELKKAFHDSVEDYLAYCKARGEVPERPFSGQFVTRISPDLHRRINRAAALAGKSLNAWVTDQLEDSLRRVSAEERLGARKQRLKSKPSKKRPEKRIA
jgi:predicted HicB family RNase H-like nuclease